MLLLFCPPPFDHLSDFPHVADAATGHSAGSLRKRHDIFPELSPGIEETGAQSLESKMKQWLLSPIIFARPYDPSHYFSSGAISFMVPIEHCGKVEPRSTDRVSTSDRKVRSEQKEPLRPGFRTALLNVNAINHNSIGGLCSRISHAFCPCSADRFSRRLGASAAYFSRSPLNPEDIGGRFASKSLSEYVNASF